MSSAHAAEAILMLCAARTARLAAVHLDELRACGGGHSHAVRSAHSAPSSGAQLDELAHAAEAILMLCAARQRA
eukprot:jgi/Ulvmu1/8532/UM044_0066.1